MWFSHRGDPVGGKSGGGRFSGRGGRDFGLKKGTGLHAADGVLVPDPEGGEGPVEGDDVVGAGWGPLTGEPRRAVLAAPGGQKKAAGPGGKLLASNPPPSLSPVDHLSTVPRRWEGVSGRGKGHQGAPCWLLGWREGCVFNPMQSSPTSK